MVTQGGFCWLPHIIVSSDTAGDTPGDMGDGNWSIGREPWQAEINWWGQIELVNALVHADKGYGGPGTKAGNKYIQRAAKTWELVSQRFVNSTSGALHETVDRKTLIGDGINEFGPWKACYHTTRALVRSLVGGVAQLVEQRTSNPQIRCSSPGLLAALSRGLSRKRLQVSALPRQWIRLFNGLTV